MTAYIYGRLLGWPGTPNSVCSAMGGQYSYPCADLPYARVRAAANCSAELLF